MTLRTDELRDIGLFGALPEDALSFLAETLKLVDLAPGDVAFREGDEGHELFVLLAGELEIMKRSKSGLDARVAILGPRDWFGEMSVLDVMPRSATVRALSPSKLVRMTSADLDALYRRDLKAYALIVLNMAREMSRRLRVSDGLVAELVANAAEVYNTRHTR